MDYLKPVSPFYKMTFDIRLKTKALIPCASQDAVSDDELDCEMAVLARLCASLANTGQVNFVVSGFGEKLWPVSVCVDLCTFLEQLPVVCEQIMQRADHFEFDFYEQGIERRLIFTGMDSGTVTINCEFFGSVEQAPRSETIAAAELLELLAVFIRELYRISTYFCPLLVRNPMIASFWQKLLLFADRSSWQLPGA
jgi:hypothetical protein